MIIVSIAELKAKVIKFGTNTVYIPALKIFILVKVHGLINNVLKPRTRIELNLNISLN